ncbi:hypothetical protein M8494_13605 [Serratia ureilytica]
MRLRAAVLNFFYHGVQDADEEITMTQSFSAQTFACAAVPTGPVAGRPTVTSTRFSAA